MRHQGRVPMTRAELTEKIAVLKRRKKLSWREIAAKIGPGSPVYYTAALHGQMKLSRAEAEAAAKVLGLDDGGVDRSDDLPLLRAFAGLWHDLEGAHPRGVRRRHHERHRFRRGARAPARPKG